MWRRAPDYNDILEAAWTAGREPTSSLTATWSNLSKTAKTLKDWSWTTFGSVRKQIKLLERRLFHLRSQAPTYAILQAERDAEHKLCDLFDCEEVMARQHSRVDWLKEGDRNTAFFHAKASA
jgi:hypothetical protein